MKILRPLVIVFAALGASAFANDPVTIVCDQVYENMKSQRVCPVAITLENKGNQVAGTLTVTSGSQNLHFDLDLPQGSTKKVVAYIAASFNAAEINFSGPHANANAKFEVPYYNPNNGRSVLTISDSPGIGSYLQHESKDSSTNVGNCRPADVPDRAEGFTGISCVLMGPGSERISSAAADSLKRYVVGGGTLMFTGGANSSIVSDPRWASLLPLKNLRRVNLEAGTAFEGIAHIPIRGEFTLMTGDASAGTHVVKEPGGRTLVAQRAIGLGHVVFVGIDPNESPFNHWEGREAFIGRYTNKSEMIAADQFRAVYESENNQVYGFQNVTYSGAASAVAVATPGVPAATITPGTSSSYSPISRNSPFNVKLPPAEKIFSVLGIYFVVVIPLNFLILRKLKKGELAWFTAPIISLIFAGYLFKSAQSLYSFSSTTSTEGAIVWSEEAGTGMFYGATDLFIAKAGTYDLGLHNVERIAASDINDFDYHQQAPRFDVLDTGRELQLKSLDVGNLTFRSLPFEQKLETNSMLKTSVVSTKGQNVKLRITNASPWQINELVAWNGSKPTPFKDLKVGESVEVSTDYLPSEKNVQYNSGDVRNFSRKGDQIVITAGRVDGFRPGPQIGNEANGQPSVGLVQLVNKPVSATLKEEGQ